MRDYRGVSYDRIEDLKSREAISTIDEFLRQLSFGIGNLNAGKRADSSGRPTTPVSLDDYFYLPGRNGGQLGHGGNAASDPLTLASTRHTTKGSIYLGTAQQSAFDELNNRFGVGAPAPEVGLHINKQPAEALSLAASSDIAQVGDGWANNTTSGFAALSVSPTLGTSDDTDTLYGGGPPATTRNYHGGLDGTVAAATESWTITYVARRSGDMIGTVQFRVTRSDGTSALSAAIDLTTFTLTYATYTAVVSSGWGTGSGAAFTANSFSATIAHQNGTPYLSISYLRVTPTAGGGLASSITLFERPAISTAPYSVWRDESDITVASITSTGAGKFQNVLLEDPGAGTGTISLIAPTGVTPYALTLPLNDGDANELLQTNGSGTLDFVTLSGDATVGAGGALTLANSGVSAGAYGSSTSVPTFTVDAKGRLTVAANVAIAFPGGLTGFAIPTVDVDVLAEDAGVALTALRSDARLQLSQAITPTWTGAHTWTAAAAITAVQINQHAAQSTNLLRVSSSAAVGDTFLRIGSTGEVFFGHNGGTQDDAVRKVLVRGNSTQSLDLVAIQTETTTISAFDATARFKFFDSTGTNSTTFDRTAAGSNHVLTWPAAQGAADRYIRNDGAGALTWAQVSLTAGVTGILPIANGGSTGTNTGDQTSIVGITGTTAQFNTALTDNDFATIAGVETLTSKTLTTPTIVAAGWANANHTHAGSTTGGTITLADTTGTLLVGRGGTGLAVGTSGGILGFTDTTTLASSALLTASQLIVGGGTGATPATLAGPGVANRVLRSAASTFLPTWAQGDIDMGTTANILGGAMGLGVGSGNAQLAMGGTYSATTRLLLINSTLDHPTEAGQLSGIQAQFDVRPRAAGLTALYGGIYLPRIVNSATNIYLATSFYTKLSTSAYTGSISFLTGGTIAAPDLSGGGSVSFLTGLDVEDFSAVPGVYISYGLRSRSNYGTNKWNLYIDGTADNYCAGSWAIGAAPEFLPTAKVHIKGPGTAMAALRLEAGAAPTSPNAGDIWNDSTQKALLARGNNINQSLDGTLFTQTADKEVANTTTATSLFGTGVGSLTLPTNFFVVGKNVRLTMRGIYGTTGTPTLNIILKVGSAVSSTSALTLPTVSSTRLWDLSVTITCRSVGAFGSIMAICSWRHLETASGAGTVTEWEMRTYLDGAVTIDTTAQQIIDVTATWGTANASNTITSKTALLEIEN